VLLLVLGVNRISIERAILIRLGGKGRAKPKALPRRHEDRKEGVEQISMSSSLWLRVFVATL
jgi:hypothetical protein